jgi:type I restriction enzyme, S subunit
MIVRVPSHPVATGARWITTVGDVCDRFGGSVQTGPFGSQLHASDYEAHGVPVVMPQDLHGGVIRRERIARVKPKHAIRLKQHVLRVGDVVFSRRGDVSRFAIVSETEDGWLCGTGSIRIRLNAPDVEVGYLRHYLHQEGVGNWLRHHAKGVTMPNLNTQVIRALPLVYPPVSEQRWIAEILDKADALRAKRRAALAQLEALKQFIFNDMFGDREAILNRWPMRKLGELLDFLTSGSRGWASHYSDSGDLFLRIQNVGRDQLLLDDVAFVRAPDTAEARRTRVQVGDVLLSITADLGRTAVVPDHLGRAFINQHLAILRTKAVVPRFLSGFLSSPSGQTQLAGRNRHGVKAGLNFDDIRSITVPMPPSNLQVAFVDRVRESERLLGAAQSSLRVLDALFASLQHRAFRGEL